MKSAATMFNGAIAASAVAALDELRFFETLADAGSISIEDFCALNELHDMTFEALLQAVGCFGVVSLDREKGSVEPGPAFEDALANKGYFLWLIRGYGGMLADLSSVATLTNRVGDFIERDGERIAVAGKDYGARFVDDDFHRVLHMEDFMTAADLGCGSAERLIQLARARPEFRGVGVEYDEGAVAHAKARVRKLGLDDRITVLRGDVSALDSHDSFADVDVVFSFFMAHDLWPRQRCVDSLNGVARAFPKAGRFLLCDTYHSGLPPREDMPIFTLGFEVTHAAMGQQVPTEADWVDLFGDTDWSLEETHPIGIAYSSIFDLRRDLG